jgi:Rad3-related DNA helicase
MAAARKLGGPVYGVVPTKALVKQASEEYPDLTVAYGRNEHVCPWAVEDFKEEPENPVTPERLIELNLVGNAPRASEVATMVCKKCPHYVDSSTGQTNKAGVVECPYYRQKYQVDNADAVLCTMAFYLFHFFFNKAAREDLKALIIDEAHELPKVVRYCLSFEVSDHLVNKAIDLLQRIGNVEEETRALKKFCRAMKKMAKAKQRPSGEEVLLDDEEVVRLVNILQPIDTAALENKLHRALNQGIFDLAVEKEAIKMLEVLAKDLRRYVTSFMMALPKELEDGNILPPLTYTCSFYRTEREAEAEVETTGDQRRRKKVLHKLVVHCAHVAPLIKKLLLPKHCVALSATIGNADAFKFISGIDYPILRLGSSFPIEQRRIYVPKDIESLVYRQGAERRKHHMLKRIAQQCQWFNERHQRCLVVVVSEEEREYFIRQARDQRLDLVTYGNGVAAKDAVVQFKARQGGVLLGTSAHFAQGIDLPDQLAPVIFFLRPGYPDPHSPQEQFKKRRFGESTTAWINKYLVMQQIIQAAGRNIRGPEDRGVIICCDARFTQLVSRTLHNDYEWLRPCFVPDLTWEQCMADAMKLFA